MSVHKSDLIFLYKTSCSIRILFYLFTEKLLNPKKGMTLGNVIFGNKSLEVKSIFRSFK